MRQVDDAKPVSHYEAELPDGKGGWALERWSDGEPCEWDTQADVITHMLGDCILEFRVVRVNADGTRTAFIY